jgi:hypothetical protein
MPYTLSLTNNTALTTLQDGSVNQSSTSLTLIGKNYPGYGTFLNENFIQLLEHFSNSTAPSNPLPGQLWWDSSMAVMKVNAATSIGTPIWKIISSSTSGSSAPTNPIIGDLWWDSSNSQLKVYSGAGSSWVTIGPAFTASTGQSGAIADTITGVDGPHVVVKFLVSNTLVAILSKDPPFTPQTTITGFSGTIKPGLNFASQSPSLVYYGDSNSALNLKIGTDLVPASSFLRSDIITPTLTKLQVQVNEGIDIGTVAQGSWNVNAGLEEMRFINSANNYDTVFYNKVSSVITEVMRIQGTDGLVVVAGDPTVPLGVATKNYVDTANVNLSNSVDARISANIQTAILRDGSTTVNGNILPTTSNAVSLGSSTRFYANIWAQTFRGTAITAQYADLAEMYVTDKKYDTGTVVAVGGEKEVTACSTNSIAIGVVSAKPAFLMNEKLPGQAIALKGRVPVKVSGPVTKGAGLIAGNDGTAITTYHAGNCPDSLPAAAFLQRTFAVSMEDNDDPEVKLVECVIL